MFRSTARVSRPPFHGAGIAVLILFLVGCGRCGVEPPTETDYFNPELWGEHVFDGKPDIEAPERLLLHNVGAGESVTVTAEVFNVGRATLKISEWTISDAFDLSFANSLDEPTEIRAGESVVIAVTHQSLDGGEARGVIGIETNDPDEPFTEIELFANAKFPCLETIPDDFVNFGEVRPGENSDRVIEIRNCSENAETTFTLAGITGDPAFGYARDPGFETMTLDVGESVSIALTFEPPAAGDFRGALVVESDDEFRPHHELELHGVGSLGQCPVAVITVSHIERGEGQARPTGTYDAVPLDRLRLTGADSQAYGGKIISHFEWSLVRKPADSAAILRDPTSMTNELYLDLAGEYIVELTVEDNEQVESCGSARMTIRAVSNEDIHIQLVWDTPNDPDQTDTRGSDVDLHFFDPNQPDSRWNDDPWDCFWQNLMPDWGVPRPAGVTSQDCLRDPMRRGCDDDPSLDIDDVDGWGPENINLNNPRINWSYAIGVHYFSDHSYGASFVTVRVYVGGLLKAEYRRQRLLHNQFWYVADIEWPSARITPRGEVLNRFP